MFSFKKINLIITTIGFTFFFTAQSQNMKWMLLAIQNAGEKEYVISKIQSTPGLKYIAYCNTHQIILLKYDTQIFNNGHVVLEQFINTDEKLKSILIEKYNMDDERSVKDLINYCDFEGREAENTKQELQN